MTEVRKALAGGFHHSGGSDTPSDPGYSVYRWHRKKSKPHTAIGQQQGLYGTCNQTGKWGERPIREYAHLFMLREQATWELWPQDALDELQNFSKMSELDRLKLDNGSGVVLQNALFFHLLMIDGGIPTRGIDVVNFKPLFEAKLKQWVENLPIASEKVARPVFGTRKND